RRLRHLMESQARHILVNFGPQLPMPMRSTGGAMAMVPRCLTVVIVIILLSARAYAASFVSQFEYHSFWSDILPIILMAGLAIVVTWRLRKWIRQQVALAPPEANRNPRERRLHRLSLVLIAAPMFSAFLLEVDLF